MSRFSKTWWGQRFLAALESFTDQNRLARGRSYAGDRRIKEWEIEKGRVMAKVLGNKNPYFGVYHEPTYETSIAMTPIAAVKWKKIVTILGERSGYIAKLMANEMPERIEEAFLESRVHLLPENSGDFKVQCSCPDYEVPCKHIAGACYRLASLLDQDPFLLFELRGLSREKLHEALAKSPLGRILSSALAETSDIPPPAKSFYTRPEAAVQPDTADPKAFWSGEQALPTEIEPVSPNPIPAILIKKGGDYPPFWEMQSSFVEIMEEFYERVRKANRV